MWLLAEVSGGEYGVLGAVVMALLGSVTWLAKDSVTKANERGDRLEMQLRESEQARLSDMRQVMDRVFPALSEAASAVRESNELVKTKAEENRELVRILTNRKGSS